MEEKKENTEEFFFYLNKPKIGREFHNTILLFPIVSETATFFSYEMRKR
jgi:hypothetical protein